MRTRLSSDAAMLLEWRKHGSSIHESRVKSCQSAGTCAPKSLFWRKKSASTQLQRDPCAPFQWAGRTDLRKLPQAQRQCQGPSASRRSRGSNRTRIDAAAAASATQY